MNESNSCARGRRAMALILGSFALLAGCSDTGTGGATTTTSGSGGFTFDIASNPDIGTADVAKLDTGGSDATSACPGGPACTCSSDLECDSGLCIETRDGKQCARLCNGNCPDGLTCSLVTGSSGDNVSICLDRAAHLCDPCSTDADCQALGFGTAQALCIDQGAAGHFCGIPCAQKTDCPSSYACSDVTASSGKPAKQCQREPDQAGGPPGVCPCSKLAVAHKLSTTCLSVAKDAGGQVIGQCPGVRQCLEAGLGDCDAPPRRLGSLRRARQRLRRHHRRRGLRRQERLHHRPLQTRQRLQPPAKQWPVRR